MDANDMSELSHVVVADFLDDELQPERHVLGEIAQVVALKAHCEDDLVGRIERADAYSAHADRTGLLGWAEAVRNRGQVSRYFLVHGEEDSAEALARDLRSAGTAEVEVPERGSVFELA